MALVPIEFEILIPLLIAMFFSAFYEIDQAEYLWAGIVAMGVWMVMGGVYLIISNLPFMALIFMAVGILYIIRILIQLIDLRKMSRHLT